MNRIIYKTDEGGVAVIIPAPEWLAQSGNTIEKLAEMRVPEGKPFKIVDVSDIPEDRTFREAWTMPEEEEATDGVGGEGNEFPEDSPETPEEEPAQEETPQ